MYLVEHEAQTGYLINELVRDISSVDSFLEWGYVPVCTIMD